MRNPSGTTSLVSVGPSRAVGALFAILAIALPAHALAGPATDEYTLDLPNAKGKKHSNADAPVTDAGALPADVAAELADDPNGKALAAIASAEELGAPRIEDVSGADSGEDSSAAGAAAGTLTDPLVLGVGLAMLAIGGALFVLRGRRDTNAP